MLIPKGLSAQWIRVRWGWRSSRWSGGRRQASDTIDYSVGTDMARLGGSIDGRRRSGDSCQRRSQLAGSGEGRQSGSIARR